MKITIPTGASENNERDEGLSFYKLLLPGVSPSSSLFIYGEADEYYFESLFLAGRSLFESGVAHHGACGNWRAMGCAISVLKKMSLSVEHDPLVQTMLWSHAGEKEVMIDKRPGGKSETICLDSFNIQNMTAMSLFIDRVSSMTTLTFARLTKVNLYKSSSCKSHDPDKDWGFEKQGVWRQMIELCNESSRKPPNSSKKQTQNHHSPGSWQPLVIQDPHPMTLLMTAAIDLTPSSRAVQAILDVAGVAALQPGGCLGLSAKHALFSRRLDLVKFLVEAAPAREPPKLKSLSLSKSDRKAAGLKHEGPAPAPPFSPSLGIVTELLFLAPSSANALTRSVAGVQSTSSDLNLLPHEVEFVDMVKLLCQRENDSAPELLLRLMIPQFSRLVQNQVSATKSLNRLVLTELSHQLDVKMGTEKAQPWVIPPGLAEDFAANLLQFAIAFRCADLIGKLKPVLISLGSTRTGPWIGAMLSRPIGDEPSHLNEFIETLQVLHACGVDLNQPVIVEPNETRVDISGRFTDPYSADASAPRTPLTHLAMKRNAKNEVTLKVMACLLDLGVDAQAKDEKGKTSAIHLPAAYRAGWNALVRSKKSLSQARAALAEIFENEIFGNEESNEFRKQGNSTGSMPGSLGRI